MKKKFVLLLLSTLAFGSLAGCSTSKSALTYGTLITQDLNSLKELSNQELSSKAKNENEVFLLAVHQGIYSEGCNCWTTFENVITKYMNKCHDLVYVFNAQKQDDSVSTLKIDKMEDSNPFFYIFKGEKILAKYSYKNSKDKVLFEDADKMEEKVRAKVKSASMYYVDDIYLSENLSKKDKSVVLFMRRGCDDCSYVIPNVIIPYINKHSLKENLWLFDMQDVYNLSKNEAATEEEKAQYQALKDKYGLSTSSNNTFGYQQGVVPTIHYYEKNILKDASVFFNDVVSQKEDGSFYISESYYSEERLNNLSFLKDVKFTSKLESMTIDSNSAMQTKSGSYYWNQAVAAKYHTPILEAFLSEYLS